MDLLKKVSGIRGGSSFLNPFVIKLLVIMFFVEFVKGSLIVSLLPEYMGTRLGLSASAIGLALSLQYVGDSLFRSPIGWLIDRIGYRWCVLFGVTFTFISVILLSTQDELKWIIVASALLGIGTSPLWPAVIAGATESFGDQAKGTLMSVIYLAWLSGIGLGPIVINFFVHYSYAAAFMLLIVLMSGVTLVTLLLPGKLKKKSAEAESLAERSSTMTHKKDAGHRIQRINNYFINVRKSLKFGKLFLVALFAQTFAIGLITPVLTLYARTVLNLSPFQYSFFLIFGGAIAVGFLIPMGRFVDRYGTRWFLHAGFVLTAMMLISITFVGASWGLYLLVAILGLGFAMIIPAWNTLIAEAIPEKERGAIWGFILTIEGLGTISGPIVSGRLWDQINFHAPFVASGIVLLLLFVFHIVITAGKKVVVR